MVLGWDGIIRAAEVRGDYRVSLTPAQAVGKCLHKIYDFSGCWLNILNVTRTRTPIHLHLYHKIYNEYRPAIITPDTRESVIIRIYSRIP
jgi:hypothetical protein